MTAKDWIVAVDTASAEALAVRPDLTNPDSYRPNSEVCPDHGGDCVKVVFGVLMQHVHWRLTNPIQFAAAVLELTLPKAGVRER